MKKLYFLDEEEKNRILNLHESATKNQYLDEQWGVGQQSYTPAEGTVDAAIVDPAKKAERIKNISKIVCSLKGDTITNKGSKHNGKSWVDYISTYKITSTEEAQAKKLCSTGGDERLYNIAKIACNVDASGKINVPKSKHNGRMFTDYISTYKLTGAEVTKAKTLCGKLGNKPAAVNSPAEVNSPSKSNSTSTATIAPRVQAVQKSLGIQNGTGTLDAATLQAMLTKLNGGVQAAAPAVGAPVVAAGTPAAVAQTPEQLQQIVNKIVNKPV